MKKELNPIRGCLRIAEKAINLHDHGLALEVLSRKAGLVDKHGTLDERSKFSHLRQQCELHLDQNNPITQD